MAALLVAVLALTSVLLAGCTHAELTPEDPARPAPARSSAAATDPLQRTSAVAVDGSVQVEVSSSKVTVQQRKAFATGWPKKLPVAVGAPVEVSAESIPETGIALTRRYSKPLPEGASATLAFYDSKLQGWRAVPSQLAGDRLSVSATVHHLSLWTDVVGLVGGATDVASTALADASTWAYVQVGAVFSTRADQPTCPSGKPTWVDDVMTLDDSPENPIRFCFGNDDEQLIIKATVNRGFGFVARPADSVTDFHNGTFNPDAFDEAIRTAVHIDDNFRKNTEQLLGGKNMVGAGETVTLTFDESAGRDAGQNALRMDAPSTLQYLTSLLARLTGQALGDKADGWVGTGLMLARCATDLQDATDGSKRAKAIVTCAGGLDYDVARQLVNFSIARKKAKVLKAGGDVTDPALVKVDGYKIGGAVGRASIYLALIGPVFDSFDYVAAKNLNEASRSASLFVKPEADVTVKMLKSAEVPAACRMPKQRLERNKTVNSGAQSGPEGWMSLTDPEPVFADVARLGYRQAVTYYVCHAGGVPWPPVVTLTGHRGKLLGHVNLDQLTKDAHGDRGTVDRFQVSGSKVVVRWTSTAGCCTALAKHNTVLEWSGSKLRVASEAITKWSADGVAYEIAAAAVLEDRSRLLDPTVVPDDVWKALVAAGSGADEGFAGLPFDGETTDGDKTRCELTLAFPGSQFVTWDVWMAPANNLYGWKLVSATPP